MNKAVAVAGIFGILLSALAGPARADFILFLHSYGEWTVICARDEPTERKRCRLSAPNPHLGLPASGIHVRVDVVTGRGNTPQVEVRVQHLVDPARPLSLQIDNGPAYEVLPPRTGEVAWTGPTAAAIVAAMAKGQTLAARFFEPGREDPLEHLFALKEFPKALAQFREVAVNIEGAGR